MTEVPRPSTRGSASRTPSRPAEFTAGKAVGQARGVRMRNAVVKLLADAGYQVTARRRLANNLAWQLRLATGQIVNVYDTGSLVVQGVGPEPVRRLLQRVTALNAAQGQGNSAPARDTPNRPSCARAEVRPARPERPQLCADAKGYPIRLPGTDAVLAMGPPPPRPKIWDNPKTLRHMENRLRALGYRIRSETWVGDKWWIKLQTGQTVCYREGGLVCLAPFQRDYRLERLFRMEEAPDQIARPFPR